jgi:hypothetical protein
MGSEWILGRLALGGVDWIRLAQDRDRWRAVVSAVMNLRVLAPRNYLVSYVYTLDCMVGNVNVSIGLTIQL